MRCHRRTAAENFQLDGRRISAADNLQSRIALANLRVLRQGGTDRARWNLPDGVLVHGLDRAGYPTSVELVAEGLNRRVLLHQHLRPGLTLRLISSMTPGGSLTLGV